MVSPVLLDTDIGSDVDDLLAFLMVLGSPELELAAIATTYGDTSLRALIVKRLCEWTGTNVPIAAGPPRPLSGRPVWYAGHEAAQVDPATPGSGFTPAGLDEIAERVVAATKGRLVVIAIGPLTNLAAGPLSRVLQPGIAADLAIMGGDFRSDGIAEHNLRSDAVAAERVFSSAAPITAIGLDQTLRLPIDRAAIHSATAGASALAEFARTEIDRWLATNDTDSILVHDPLAVATVTHPEQFVTERGSVAITPTGEDQGMAQFTPDASGTTRLVRTFDPDSVRELILERIRVGLSRGA